MTKEKKKISLKRLLFILLVTGITVYSGFPIYWMIICSLRPYIDLFNNPSLLPWPFTTASYTALFTMTNYATYFKNSIIVAIGTTTLTLMTVAPLSYILTRLRIKSAGIFIRLMLVAYMFPTLLLAIPMFIVFSKLSLYDTLFSVMIGQSTLTIPLGVWLMWGFYKGVPFDLEEAALIDGATPFQSFVKIIVPISRPGLITTALFSFILSWTDYVFALTLTFSDEHKTLPLGLAAIYGATDMRWGELMAGSALITIPSVIAFTFVTRYLVQGLTAGAVKG